MAIIGLYDADMAKYTQVPFNLDLMKIAAYHKKHYDMTIPIKFVDVDKYSKIIYRKDYYDGEFESHYLKDKRIEYGGRAFSQNKYISLGEEIESMVPDRYIYEIYREDYCDNLHDAQTFQRMMNSQHLRLSLDGHSYWDNWRCQIDPSLKTNNYIFHDYDIGSVEGVEETIKWINELPGKNKKRIGAKFPIQIYTDEQLDQWGGLYPILDFYNLWLNGVRGDEAMYNWALNRKARHVTDQAYYNITYGCSSEEEVIARLPKIYKQLIFFRMNRLNLRLIYDDTIFSRKEWLEVLRLVQMYIRQGATMRKNWFEKMYKYDSLYSFVRSFNEEKIFVFKNLYISKAEARDMFQFVRENCYELFCSFYDCHTVELKGGEFRWTNSN